MLRKREKVHGGKKNKEHEDYEWKSDKGEEVNGSILRRNIKRKAHYEGRKMVNKEE